MAKHTPGPWKAEKLSITGVIQITDERGRSIAQIWDWPEEVEANARLIARSPSMLALLKRALPIIRAEADRRDAAPVKVSHGYWTEMDELANEINAEIDKTYGKGASDG